MYIFTQINILSNVQTITSVFAHPCPKSLLISKSNILQSCYFQLPILQHSFEPACLVLFQHQTVEQVPIYQSNE